MGGGDEDLGGCGGESLIIYECPRWVVGRLGLEGSFCLCFASEGGHEVEACVLNVEKQLCLPVGSRSKGLTDRGWGDGYI